jgi:hypothetical protein
MKTLLDEEVDVDDVSEKIAALVYNCKGDVSAILMNASIHLMCLTQADIVGDVPRVTIGQVEIPWPMGGETVIEYAARIKAAVLAARSPQGAV